MGGPLEMMLVLEKQPVIGQLLLAFNHMTRHYKSWQVGEPLALPNLSFRVDHAPRVGLDRSQAHLQARRRNILPRSSYAVHKSDAV